MNVVTADSVKSRWTTEKKVADIATLQEPSFISKMGVVWLVIDCMTPPSIDKNELGAYLKGRLMNRGCSGKYSIWGIKQWKYFYHYKFNNAAHSVCPLCKEIHDAYGFEYSVRHGMYGGWKCWKTGEWESDFTWDAIEKFAPHPRLW